MPLIDPTRLRPLLGPLAPRWDVDALDTCTSSSDVLLERATQGAPSGTVVVADRQTAGRGRRGRSWVSDPAASLTFSLLWRFPAGSPLSGLSLAAGAAVASALERLGVHGVALKWPNDILFAHATGYGKLGGILVELASDRRGLQAVLGIGLNLTRPPAEALDTPPAALADGPHPLPERHRLLATLLEALFPVLDRFAETGFTPWRDAWQARNAWQDQRVRLLRDGDAELEGFCRGVDADGALLIDDGTALQRCLSGDLSLRRA